MQTFLFPRRFRLILFCVLAFQASGFSFQLADGAPPAAAPADKFILYWGSLQCDLSAANQYHGVIETTPAVFRQVLLSAPHLWDGTRLIHNFLFRLEDQAINTDNYTAQISGLDAAFGQKVVPGQVLHLTQLALDDRIRGSIDFQIKEPEAKDANGAGDYWRNFQTNFVNTQLVERVTWGREDAYDISNRDFFTAAEFWQTVRQMPYVEWQPYSTPQPLVAFVRFPDLKPSNFSLVWRLESTEYRQMAATLDNYRHLVVPGATIELALNTAENYDEVYLKTMRLVADNDPRLALRRNRDTHVLEFNWGRQIVKFQGLYLQNFSTGDGATTPADMPLASRFGLPKPDLEQVIAARPSIRIDDQEITDFSFRLKAPGSGFSPVSTAEPLPDTAVQMIKANFRQDSALILDSFRVAGYDLPPLRLNLSFFDPVDLLPVHNDFSALMAAVVSIRVKVKAPTFDAKNAYFDLDLPGQGNVKFNIFEPEGQPVMTNDFQFSAGQHTVTVPKDTFRKKGKHICFLNTPFGVGRLEFEME